MGVQSITAVAERAILPPSQGGVSVLMPKRAKSLAEYRAERYLTVDEFADLLGITIRTLYRIQNGEVHPRPTTMRQIAERLGVHPSQITEFVVRPDQESQR